MASQARSLAHLRHRKPGWRAHVTLEAPDQRMHLVAYLRDGRSDIEVERAARRAGIAVRAISRWYRGAPPRSGLMLGFTGFSRETIVPAAVRLAEVLVR